ncbi:MAG: class C sortase [Coriobacteriales bacterium]|jgi:sortase A
MGSARLATLALVTCPLLVMLGVALMLQPVVSKELGSERMRAQAFSFAQTPLIVEGSDEALSRAQDMNRQLLDRDGVSLGEDGAPQGYWGWPTSEENEVVATVSIPTLGVTLPVRLGTGEYALANGAGHLPGTSMPVGGQGTRCVIAGHTAYGDAVIFDDIGTLVAGDVVWLTSVAGSLRYVVHDSRVIDPDDVDALAIEEGSDMLTLLTCYPRSVNTQRLIVNCVRDQGASPSEESQSGVASGSDAGSGDVTTARSGNLMPVLALSCALTLASGGAVAVALAVGVGRAGRRRAAGRALVLPESALAREGDDGSDGPVLHTEAQDTCYDSSPRQVRPARRRTPTEDQGHDSSR